MVMNSLVNEQDTRTYNVKGRLCLHFVCDEQRQQTRLARNEQQPPLRVIRAFPLAHGAALVHLHNISGGVLGGDTLELAVDVGPQASVQLTSTSATRIYRSRPNTPVATQNSTISVQEGGLLEYLPDPLIPFAGARYQQRTHIDLAAGAGLFWWETIAPGRTARDELFAYDLLRIDTRITAQGRPLAIERTILQPQRRALSTLARLGPYRYISTFYICRVGLEAARWTKLERALQETAQRLTLPGETLWGVSTLVAHGLLVRTLSRQGHDIPAGLLTFWREAKQALYDQEAIPPRKVY